MNEGPRRERLIRDVKESAPTTSGVYVFRGGGRCLYVGKSVNLRRRMLEHLRSDAKHPRSQIRRLAFEIEEVSYHETETELLALLLEDRLIKEEHPEYNTRQRDYSEYCYLCLTDAEFPNLRIVAWSEEAPAGTLFGPFRDRHLAEDLKRISEDHLRLRACADLVPTRKSARYDLGQCSAPCRRRMSPADYAPIARRVHSFLKGDSSFVVAVLDERIKDFAAAKKYEAAHELKRLASFCRKFCVRQEFLTRYRTETLVLRSHSERETYVFDRGRLVEWNGMPRSSESETYGDPRFVLDRGHLVHSWLLRHRERCEFRFTHSTT